MQHRTWAMRGRPRGNFHSPVDIRILEYLAEISVKHMIDSNEFFDKIVYAWENRRSKCKELDIECRVKTKGSAIFLITAGYTVVAQFPIAECVLKEAAPLEEFTYIIEREKLALMKKRNENEKKYLKIKDLKQMKQAL